MFSKLHHKSLGVYGAVRDLVKEVYRVTALLPAEERFNMVSQMRRAALSIKLNLAEGATRRSDVERKRFFEIARGSVVEVDAVVETAVDLSYFEVEELKLLGELLNKCFAMLSNMIN